MYQYLCALKIRSLVYYLTIDRILSDPRGTAYDVNLMLKNKSFGVQHTYSPLHSSNREPRYVARSSRLTGPGSGMSPTRQAGYYLRQLILGPSYVI